MVYITTPVIPSCLVSFFSDPYSHFKISNFLFILIRLFTINDVFIISSQVNNSNSFGCDVTLLCKVKNAGEQNYISHGIFQGEVPYVMCCLHMKSKGRFVHKDALCTRHLIVQVQVLYITSGIATFPFFVSFSVSPYCSYCRVIT